MRVRHDDNALRAEIAALDVKPMVGLMHRSAVCRLRCGHSETTAVQGSLVTRLARHRRGADAEFIVTLDDGRVYDVARMADGEIQAWLRPHSGRVVDLARLLPTDTAFRQLEMTLASASLSTS